MDFMLLPPDLIAYLCDLVPSQQVLLLWLTGDSRMQRSLRFVTSLVLEDVKRMSTSRWPQFLVHLHRLQVLKVKRRPGRLGSQIFPAQLMLMSSLRSLTLDLGGDDLEQWFHAMQKPWQHYFPSLARLELSPADPLNNTFPVHARTLPDGLEHLKFLSISYDVALLPQNLTSLHSTLSVWPKDALHAHNSPNLPQLQSLSLFILDCRRNTIEELPQTLTALTLYLVRSSNTMNNISRIIPPSVTHLQLTLREEPTETDPQAVTFATLENLKHLKLNSYRWTCHLDHDSLPSSIESMELSVPFHNSKRLVLPPKLKTFKVKATEAFQRVVFHRTVDGDVEPGLPPSLTSFTFPRVAGNPGEFAPIDELSPLPPGLRHLQVGEKLSPNCFQQLPKSLTSLNAGDEVVYSRNAPLHILPAFDFPCLVSLEIMSASQMHLPSLKLLPRSMTKLLLAFKGLSAPMEESLLETFPPGLLYLEIVSYPTAPFDNITRRGFTALTAFRQLTNLAIQFEEMSSDIQDQDLLLLPRTLHLLHLKGTTPFTSAGFAYLPRYLRSLLISKLQSVESSDVVLLPRSLTALALHSHKMQDPNFMGLAPSPLSQTELEGVFYVPETAKQVSGQIAKINACTRSDAMDPRTPYNSFVSHNDPLNGAKPTQLPISMDEDDKPEQKWRFFATWTVLGSFAALGLSVVAYYYLKYRP